MNKLLIKLGLWLTPKTPEGHKQIEPIFNGWVDKANKTYWKPSRPLEPAE